ncbi:hypothetical protein H5410_061017 [Solanum commersonii]|uniref:Uncharacterized protein n=1 Tax=Solanum commersonii TaxID=4109 RepID=A0A9J5W6K4_SOLCO|nr:hypothetical protein H5410_061017 [Solanum commersonii]
MINDISSQDKSSSSSGQMVHLEDIPKDKNSDLQREDEPWKIFQRYLDNELYFPGESYKTRSYYEEILINTEVENLTLPQCSIVHMRKFITSQNHYQTGYIHRRMGYVLYEGDLR